MTKDLENDEVSEETLRYVLENVFMPAKLPDEEDPDLTVKDSALLSEVFKAANLFKKALNEREDVPHETIEAWNKVTKMFHTMLESRATDRLEQSAVEAQLQSMEIGDVFPIYVPLQNAGIIFRKRSAEELSFESFEISLPNGEVMETEGKVIVVYPPKDRLLVPTDPALLSPLANAISFFGSQSMDDAVATLTKAGFGHENIRDTASPHWITEALAGVLRAVGRVDVREDGTPAIRKRINDHVILGPGSTLPWRRSPMWLLIRVALQTTLGERNVPGGDDYKAFQAYFMARLLEKSVDATVPIVPDDVIHAMNQKLARRMRKMKKLVDSNRFASLPSLQFVAKVIETVSVVLEKNWVQDRQEYVEPVRWTPPTKEEIEESLELSLKTNEGYLRSVVGRTEELSKAHNDYDDEAMTRTLIAACSLRLDVHRGELPTTINAQELELGLMDFEFWVENQLPTWSEATCRSEKDCGPLSSIMEAYTRCGMSHYAESPENMSILWLTLMELWVSLDKLVVKWCPIMKDFSPEIPTDMLDPLLLPSKSHLQRLASIQSYISDRHRDSSGRSLFGDIDSPESFQNVYFAQSSEMQREKIAIEQWAVEQRELKVQEMAKANEQYADWKSEHDRIECNYFFFMGYSHHEYVCRKCMLHVSMQKKVPKFEEPLPADDNVGNPVVFELNCPVTFGLWREATYQILLKAFTHNQGSNNGVYNLGSYRPTSRFHHALERRISIASFTAPIDCGSLANCSVPSKPTDAIVPHSGQYRLSYNGAWLAERAGCVLRGLSTLCLDEPYASLGRFIQNTSHYPNEVIASQADCPTAMKLEEYHAFGHLRSGNEIQLRNIMRYLINNSLSLNEGGVHSLIVQALWQAGPNDWSQAWCRSAHVDLLDGAFAADMLVVLRESLEKLGESGREVFHLATLVTLATRLSSLSQDGCLSFLAEARKTTSDWMNRLKREAEADGNAQLRHRLALVAAVCRLTFDVDDDLLDTFCESPANIATLLFTKMAIAADSTQYLSLSHATRLILRRERRLSYRLEIRVASKLRQCPTPLNDATCKMLKNHQDGKQWEPLASDGFRWWKCTEKDANDRVISSVCVDILNGNLLVDGKPINRLPESYISHGTYQQLFGHNVSLWCYPSQMKGMEYEASYSGTQLYFAMIQDSLIVRALRDGAVEEYVPRDRIEGDVPSSFLRHHHWYLEARGAIEFRPLETPWHSDGHNWILKLSTSLRGSLEKVVSKGERKMEATTVRRAVDPHSPFFGRLHSMLEALEPTALNMTALSPITKESLLEVALPRHNLQFFLNLDQRLECRSFPEYLLDSDRDIGCLYGLVNRIVLCDSSPSKRVRKVVVPRGTVVAVNSPRRHPMVRVIACGVTGFHSYDVDTLVGRLRGTGTMESDLFLIQLHAFTSSHQPDPLTKRTGTEESLHYLESASLLSHHEASHSWRERMERIAGISPRRDYYPRGKNCMERIEWNHNLPSASQHPGFEQQVVRILFYWNNTYLQKVYLDQTGPLGSAAAMAHLSRRAALRDLRYTGVGHQYQGDQKHVARGALHCHESRTREALAHQVTDCVLHLKAGLPICDNMKEIAKEWHEVKRAQGWGSLDLPKWLLGPLSDIWCSLYELCCNAPLEQGAPRIDLAVTLAMLAHRRSVPLSVMGMLMAIIRDPQFRETGLHHPVGKKLDMSAGYRYAEAEIRPLIEPTEIGFENSKESNLTDAPRTTYYERRRLAEENYRQSVEEEVLRTLREVKAWWDYIPNRHTAITVSATYYHVNLAACIRHKVRPLLDKWIRNEAFLEHLRVINNRISQPDNSADKVVAYRPQDVVIGESPRVIDGITLGILMDRRSVTPNYICGSSLTMPSFAEEQSAYTQDSRISRLHSFVESLDSVLLGRIGTRYRDDFLESVTALSASPPALGAQIPSMEILFAFTQIQESHHLLSRSIIAELLRPVSTSDRLLGFCGLWPRVTNVTLLERLSFKHRGQTSDSWITAISQFASQIIAAQQSKRLIRYGALGMVSEYNREVLHSRKRESQSDPDWLLVEIDGDLCIRSPQVEIANSMLVPGDGRNIVIQLNMGEGKSSVIVPILSATVADGKRLARVVVLKPQSKLQLNLLRARLSRLANRRVICLPFSRDLPFDRNSARQILCTLENCLADGGIWLCQPEHLLSFKLLGLDLSMRTSENSTLGAELIKCQLWMQARTRDILDESDEILHTRHQLVYTVGDQRNFDAAPKRWEIVQDILHLMSKFNVPSPHFLVDDAPCSLDQFPSIRMISDEAEGFFQDIAREIIYDDAVPSLSSSSIPIQLKEPAWHLLTQRSADKERDLLWRYFEERGELDLWKGLLLIRGLIAFKIIPFVLQKKRWKVDYGLAPLQQTGSMTDYSQDVRRTHLAVPYRAKDSPSLRSNFAHPDVLIVLTCLTYYYNGLSDSMIIQAIKELVKSDSPGLIYEGWAVNLPSQFRKLSSVNLDNDEMTIRSLHPSMGRNKQFIDFFLNRCIFPKEAKEFPWKMSTSGWDLAMKKTNPTTGFSGTNDSRFLLPTSIVQEDLPAQRHTNAMVVAHILQDQNSTVIPHENNPTSRRILDLVFDQMPRPTVLLDVGAQILDSSNEGFVKLWLAKYGENETIKAAVFFDGADNLLIMERDHSVRAFSDSPYSSRLDECVVYLDDPHTRGTDLKLPACRAAVTLGPRLVMDKLKQACMRMRKLGSGEQSVIFLAPDEVMQDIKGVARDANVTVTSSQVLMWAMKETCRQLQENVANWTMQGYEFAEREQAWSRVPGLMQNGQEIKRSFCQEEGRSLSRLYGLTETNHTWSIDDGSSIRQEIRLHLESFEPFSLSDAGAQEEQEVELVHEQEAEREVELPPPAEAALHSVHREVEDFIRTGVLDNASSAFYNVEGSFAGTSLILPAGGSSLFSNLVVTRDFHRTISPSCVGSDTDDFLRPLEWVVTSQRSPIMVALSPFEVNSLLPIFRASINVKLRLFAPRTSLTMRPLDDLTLFTLPTYLRAKPLPAHLGQQLNLYSGSLYLGGTQCYEGMCGALRLHFGKVPELIANMSTIRCHGLVKNSNGFVKDTDIRAALELTGEGFEQDPVEFLRRLFHLRRNGRSFFPSHMGQILFGRGLDESTKWR